MSETNLELLAQDIRRQPEALSTLTHEFSADVGALAGQIRRPARIYIVGCGDSLNVGMAVRFEWERLLGVPVNAIPALTFSRFEATNVPPEALVIGISQSGTVVRVLEALRAARSRGATTLAVTANGESPVGQEATTARLITRFPKLGFAPGTTSFPYHLSILYQLGLAFADEWGSRADTARARRNLERAPLLIQQALEPMWEIAREHAAGFRKGQPLLVLGAGPNHAGALFVARKMFEVPQVVALAQESEEYAHDEYSIVTSDVPSMLIAPDDSASHRNGEILQSLLRLGSPTALVGGQNLLAFGSPRWHYAVPPGLDDMYSPLITTLPGQLLTYELGRTLGASFYAIADPVHLRDGDDLIYRSALVETH